MCPIVAPGDRGGGVIGWVGGWVDRGGLERVG